MPHRHSVDESREPFQLTKWYLDCVDARGNAGIAYWANLSWHGLTVTFQRATLYETGCAPRERSSVRAGPQPAARDGRVRWASPAVRCSVDVDGASPPFQKRLLDGNAGSIDWQCCAPGAPARFMFEGAPSLDGTGYAERIDMTVPPWRLPIDELRWGRWISADATHSIIWIDWRGGVPQSLVWLDGALQPGASVRDAGVTLPEGTLTLGTPRTLHDEDVSKVVRAVPGLARLSHGTPLAMRDHKWCSRGTCARAGQAPIEGLAIHEVVWFQ